MTLLALVSATPLESNVDIVLVSVDTLSHSVIYPCCRKQETGWISFLGLAPIYCMMSA